MTCFTGNGGVLAAIFEDGHYKGLMALDGIITRNLPSKLPLGTPSSTLVVTKVTSAKRTVAMRVPGFNSCMARSDRDLWGSEI